jgi:hypothetical protein
MGDTFAPKGSAVGSSLSRRSVAFPTVVERPAKTIFSLRKAISLGAAIDILGGSSDRGVPHTLIP